MGVGGANELAVQESLGLVVEGERRAPGDDPGTAPVRERGADRRGDRARRRDVDGALEGVGDRPVAGAATDVAFERSRKVVELRVVERGTGHDQTGRAEPALEGLGIEEAALQGMQPALACQALDGGDLTPLRAEGREDAAVHGYAVDVHGAGAAVACVTPLLDPHPALLAQERTQALTRPGGVARLDAVDAHQVRSSPSSSRRTSSEYMRVRCSRQTGSPCTSS